MAFESGDMSEDWISLIVPLYKGKGEMTECKNYRGISLYYRGIRFSVVGNIYVVILVDRFRRVTGGLIDDEEGGFKPRRGCVDQIFMLNQICEKETEKKRRVYVSFIDLEKTYDRANRGALLQVLRMYDVRG